VVSRKKKTKSRRTLPHRDSSADFHHPVFQPATHHPATALSRPPRDLAAAAAREKGLGSEAKGQRLHQWNLSLYHFYYPNILFGQCVCFQYSNLLAFSLYKYFLISYSYWRRIGYILLFQLTALQCLAHRIRILCRATAAIGYSTWPEARPQFRSWCWYRVHTPCRAGPDPDSAGIRNATRIPQWCPIYRSQHNEPSLRLGVCSETTEARPPPW
jgi:hypothetical protein